MLRTWIVLVLVLIWSGLALRVREFGWHQYWATELLAGVQVYMLVPLLTPSKGVWKRTPATVRPTGAAWDTVERGPQAA